MCIWIFRLSSAKMGSETVLLKRLHKWTVYRKLLLNVVKNDVFTFRDTSDTVYSRGGYFCNLVVSNFLGIFCTKNYLKLVDVFTEAQCKLLSVSHVVDNRFFPCNLSGSNLLVMWTTVYMDQVHGFSQVSDKFLFASFMYFKICLEKMESFFSIWETGNCAMALKKIVNWHVGICILFSASDLCYLSLTILCSMLFAECQRSCKQKWLLTDIRHRNTWHLLIIPQTRFFGRLTNGEK